MDNQIRFNHGKYKGERVFDIVRIDKEYCKRLLKVKGQEQKRPELYNYLINIDLDQTELNAMLTQFLGEENKKIFDSVVKVS